MAEQEEEAFSLLIPDISTVADLPACVVLFSIQLEQILFIQLEELSAMGMGCWLCYHSHSEFILLFPFSMYTEVPN